MWRQLSSSFFFHLNQESERARRRSLLTKKLFLLLTLVFKEMSKRKLVFDTDCGVDDAFGLIVALRSPEFDVVAVTCTSGNAYIDDVCKNVATVLALCGREDVPFYRGAEHFMLREWNRDICWPGHGLNGLGDAKLENELVAAAAALAPDRKERAADALIRLSKEHDDLTLMAVGPLTNVAMACMLDPEFASRIHSFTIMGGAHQSKGNTGLASEFNVHCDPEAASICLRKFPMTRMITWEVTYANAFSWEWYNNLEDNKFTRFVRAIEAHAVAMNATNEDVEASPGLLVCDLIAVVSYACEAERSLEMQCEVELSGKHTRGATIFNWQGRSNTPPNAKIIKVDQNKVYAMVEKALYASE
jgi:purine nucleosidase